MTPRGWGRAWINDPVGLRETESAPSLTAAAPCPGGAGMLTILLAVDSASFSAASAGEDILVNA